MKRHLRVLFVLLSTAAFLRPGNSCAFSPDEPIFTQRADPDPLTPGLSPAAWEFSREVTESATWWWHTTP
jgi:hypothetical protein